MDSVWFRGNSDDAAQQQGWFLHVGGGGNIRTAATPVRLTKKMAHCFLQAPDGYSVEEALRWGQILGRGGDQKLVEAVVGSRLGESFEHEEFWETVIHWLVANPMLDPEWIGPIVDFIHEQKYAPQEIAIPGGGIEHRDPLQPNFSMKSRSVLKLLSQVEKWHDQLAREKRIPATQWERSGIGELTFSEREEEGEQLTWSIREILNVRELNAEGRAMHHCVRSYANSCRKGKTAIFSLQLTDAEGASTRLVTVAVNPTTRRLSQVRGRYNARPNGSFEHGQKRRGMGPDYRTYLRRSRAILHRWVEREELSWGSRA